MAIKKQLDLAQYVTPLTRMTVYTETGYNPDFMAYEKREAARASKNKERDRKKRGKDGSKQGNG